MAKLQIFFPNAGEITHDFLEEKITVGRLADNTVQVDDASVSSHHAQIVLENDAYHLRDLGSTNGTFVNGTKIEDAALKHGDEIRFGTVKTIFQSEKESANQELPESTAVSAETAKTSRRPPTFVTSSPLPKNLNSKDPIAITLIGIAILGIVAFGAAVVVLFGMTAPF